MSDIAHDAARSSVRREPIWRLWPIVPYACAFAAGTAGLAAGRAMGAASGADASGFEESLLLLLRFMAAMKFAGVLLAAGLLHWRLRQPIASPFAAAYVAALAAMALAAGLIWSLGAIALGALVFHVGLIAFLVLAWRDEGVQLPSRRR